MAHVDSQLPPRASLLTCAEVVCTGATLTELRSLTSRLKNYRKDNPDATDEQLEVARLLHHEMKFVTGAI